MTNFSLCANVFQFLKKCDVDTVVICAGARNAPFVFHLEKEPFQKIFFFEERSAAFFALGLMKQKNKPVAVITTSGTAAAELLPAAIEAYYQGLPLILITADRPKSYRGTGAPQAIQHIGLYSSYVEKTYDWDISQKEFHIEASLQQPVHLNVCFDEPLMDALASNQLPFTFSKAQPVQFDHADKTVFEQIEKPLIVVGQIDLEQKKSVIDFLLQVKAPIYLESLSQLKNESAIAPYILDSSDAYVKKLFQNNWCQSVVRIGGVPTLRFWRDLEDKFTAVPVFNFTDVPFSGLARPSKSFRLDFSNLTRSFSENENLKSILAEDKALIDVKQTLLNQQLHSEPAFIFALSKLIQNQPLYLGNSLPIREWDSFAKCDSAKVYANRGANGIDGQVSTYLGWSDNEAISWCLIGDLTAMYDLAALGLSIQPGKKKRLVVMNNKGGHIFKRVFNKDQFLNSHDIEFEMWAKMWKWEYVKVSTLEQLQNVSGNSAERLIIEIQPDSQQTTAFWNAWDEACRKI